jgi:hypothetical protein
VIRTDDGQRRHELPNDAPQIDVRPRIDFEASRAGGHVAHRVGKEHFPSASDE